MQSGHRHYNTLWCAGQNFITLFLNGHLIVRGAGYIVTTVAARLLTPRLIRLFTSTRITPMQTGSGVLRTLTLGPRLHLTMSNYRERTSPGALLYLRNLSKWSCQPHC